MTEDDDKARGGGTATAATATEALAEKAECGDCDGSGGGGDAMTPDERLDWLRARGVLVETAEERREAAGAAASTASESDSGGGDDESSVETVSYVLVPHDDAAPMRQLALRRKRGSVGSSNEGDLLVSRLKPAFASSDAEGVDLDLLRDQHTKHFGTEDTPPTVSDEAMRSVAQSGSVETFRLVPPVESNRYEAVNIYLDEVGMLKRLPLNSRAAQYALRAGFNPPPKFYGDVFLGRVAHRPYVHNVDLTLGADTDLGAAEWLQRATTENLEFQSSTNDMMGRGGARQPAADGEEGVEKVEEGYSWTQTDEEVEVVVPVPTGVTAREIKVSFLPRRLTVRVSGETRLQLDLYAAVDPDGCTWTLEGASSESESESSKLVISCEKGDGVSWPRVTK